MPRRPLVTECSRPRGDRPMGDGMRVASALHQPMIPSQRLPLDDEYRVPPLPESASRYAAIADQLSPLPSVPFSIQWLFTRMVDIRQRPPTYPIVCSRTSPTEGTLLP